MGPRRSKRISGEKLGNKIDELEANGRATYYLERRAAWEAKHADVECQFRFFDLLVELRLKIYAYVMATEQPRLLEMFKLPVLAMVSKRVRAEALPVFFAKCQFTTEFMSNYPEAHILDTIAAGGILPPDHVWGPVPMELLMLRIQRAAELNATPNDRMLLRGLQRRENITPAFRNIDLVIRAPLPGFKNGVERSIMAIKIPTAAKLQPVIKWDGPAEGSTFTDELEAMRGKATSKAMEIATTRERFMGFTLRDLEDVAMAFNYLPESKAPDSPTSTPSSEEA
ncbi:hypothetical protein LTR27_002177 [Elasticomyces elasticus]|nr:hypothetical protein LTR27_002177 [Elasticomyces elasticus]